MRTGFSRSGDLVFQDIKSDFLIGAYADIAERVMTKANYLGCGPYRTPSAKIHARAVLSHTTPVALRLRHATDHQRWSRRWMPRLGYWLDGLTMRLRNLAIKGDEIVHGMHP